MSTALQKKLSNKTAILGVIGAGYVGLPLAVEKAKKGFKTYLYDINQERIDQLLMSNSYIPDVSSKTLNQVVTSGKLIPVSRVDFMRLCDVITICVPTPIKKKQPDLSYILSVCNAIQNMVTDKTLVILESTTYPGTTRNVVEPILKCLVAYSPERVNPSSKHPQWDIPRVVSGLTLEATKSAVALFKHLTKKIVVVETPEVAEMSKLFENAFRNLNINFCNEVLILCRNLKINPWQVFEAAYTKPYAVMTHWPGPMGGHCIPVDPYYLKYVNTEVKDTILNASLEVQENFLYYIAERYKMISKTKEVCLVGTAYKPNVNDERESPALALGEMLTSRGYHVRYYDPLCGRQDAFPLGEVILMVQHEKVNHRKLLKDASLIFDIRNTLKWPNDPRLQIL